MRTSDPLEHPADIISGCDLKKYPKGFASNKEYIYAYPYPNPRRPIWAKGTGYGYGDSQLEADDMAWKRAIEHASKTLKFKLGIVCKLMEWLKIPRINRTREDELLAYERIAPIGTLDCDPCYAGRITKKPWEYKVTACIPHLQTIEPLRVCIEVLRSQTERPYIVVVDTGSTPDAKQELEQFRAEDVEVHYIASNAYRHSSEPVTAALDLSHSICKTPFLFHVHSDVFLMRDDFIESLTRMCNESNAAVGYRMSPRQWLTDEWEWMIGHTATMLHMPTMNRIGVTWSFQRMVDAFQIGWENKGGWPDTETPFNLVLRQNGIKPLFIGRDKNYERQRDDNIDHVRSYPGSQIYSSEHFEKSTKWMEEAMQEALERIGK